MASGRIVAAYSTNAPAMSSFSTLASAILSVYFAVPCLFLAGAAAVSLAPRRRGARAFGLAAGVSLAAAASAAALVLVSSSAPPLADPLASMLGYTLGEKRVFSVRTDVLSAVMLLLVSFVGWVVIRFSRRYLDGDPQQFAYLRRLLLTLAAVSALVMSNSLLFIALLWLCTSLSLHGLLTHFAERSAAQIAAHKKFLLSRLADACLLGAVCLTASHLHTLELDRIFEAVQGAPSLPTPLAISSVLIALSVLLKCAQLPFHGWLIQVMEAPTPVSALLHAGVVNIGGFLLIRLAPLMAHAHAAQMLLLVVGLVTAGVASLVMLTRVSIKVMLAWSTCAQMGLMLVECALGAYETALLHLVAHSLYKAHAFLSAGGAVATQRAVAMAPRAGRPGFGVLLVTGGLCLAVVTAGLSFGGLDVLGQPVHWFPIALLSLGLPSLLLNLPERRSAKVLVSVALAGVGVAVGFGGGHIAFQWLLPRGPELSATEAAPAGVAVASLVALFLAHSWLRQRPNSSFALWLYPRAFAGFYLDELFTRLTFRLWPAKLPVSLPPPIALSQPHESSPQ
jgi:NAD(P)H-quinone oxidoreductase subunit 5